MNFDFIDGCLTERARYYESFSKWREVQGDFIAMYCGM